MLGFVDIELNKKTRKIMDIGCLKENDESFHDNNLKAFIKFSKKIDFFCGHNIINHDLLYLKRDLPRNFFDPLRIIDTLFLSVLLFPERPYHKLIKDDKLDTDSINNPLNDCKTCRALFYDEVNAFNLLDEDFKEIYYNLLKDKPGFSGFFKYLKYNEKNKSVLELILNKFYGIVCDQSGIESMIKEYPVELSYALTLINTKHIESLMPSWVLNAYPAIEDIMTKLRGTPCIYGCPYCNENLNARKGLNAFFGYDNFKTYNQVPLQEEAVDAALRGKSLIAVFPTGGGKSLTYQLPALMSRENTRGLTVVISPLQSLMKDQVDNLEDINIVSAVAINGLLDPIQRKEAIDRVSNGIAGILYIAPESLRSKTIERLLISRQITRFVIDEAHCFSSWGQDFRVDYLYIADFIKHIQEAKSHFEPIPISCFTATAKKNVIEDIVTYFKDKLGHDLDIYETSSRRDNLAYKVYEVEDEEVRYKTLRNLILQEDCPTIIYASRRKRVEEIYERLVYDQFKVSKFHGGMEKDIKVVEQDKFMHGQTTIMVATSAFGMGVDKKDVGCVIHYEISSSLEDYVQESGRAGRDAKIHANCYILYNEKDLDKHFDLLNNTKINLKEIQQIWRAIKDITRIRDNVSQSALEIAKAAGWDENIRDIQTRVTTAVAALEDAGYLKRGQNSPRIFANSILAKSVMDANMIIDGSSLIPKEDIEITKRVIKSLISSKYSTKGVEDIAETRVDYLADHLGADKSKVITVVNYLRELKILNDNKDLSAFIKRTTRPVTPLKILNNHFSTLKFLTNHITEDKENYNLKEIHDQTVECEFETSLKSIRLLINYMAIRKWIELKKSGKDVIAITYNTQRPDISKKIVKIERISEVILGYLYKLLAEDKGITEHATINFSILELKEYYGNQQNLLDDIATGDDIEEALYFMQKVGAIQIEGGFMVIYSPLSIEKIEKDPRKKYTKQDFGKLENHYKTKMEQIHIVGSYADKMIEDYNNALVFVDDYFQLDYKLFLSKYFAGERRKDIERNMSPNRFKELFGKLTTEQLAVIKDKEHPRIAVAAGPGSGKTKLLVHKLASIMSTEDIRHEQLLMLTFSRAAVVEFKQRLIDIIGSAAHYIDIKTFHSFCFDVLGRIGTLEKTDQVIKNTVNLIRSGEVESSKITKMVLVIDEAQDMNLDEVELVQELIKHNENLRVIAVGDDDQNIFEFRGSSSEYFKSLTNDEGSFYELSTNFRSKKNLVAFTNQFLEKIPNRLKQKPIQSVHHDNGNISITKHLGKELIIPIVEQVLKDNKPGKTCVMARTNEQALQIAGLLRQNNSSVSLIQSNDSFQLYHIIEIRYFVDCLRKNVAVVLIDTAMWEAAMNALKEKYISSSNYELTYRILKSFRVDYSENFYMSDLLAFVYESNLSDFAEDKTILVSTYHKTKGKEFDNAYILYDSEWLNDEDKRPLYVAMTRAKSELHIHYSGRFLDRYKVENIEFKDDLNLYDKPSRLVYELFHKDVYLDYSKIVKHNIKQVMSGDKLELFEEEFLTCNGKKVIKFSKKQKGEIDKLFENNYLLTGAVIKYVLYWKGIEDDNEVLIILPELTFDKVIDSEEESETEI